MRLGIMQPYFFPYLGYFALIEATDRFVILDPVQYIRRGWINRNRILKPGFREPQYVRVPVASHARDTPIRDIRIGEESDWRCRILRQLRHYSRRAPYFAEVSLLVERCLALRTDSLVKLNVHCLQEICNALEIAFDHVRFEDLEIRIDTIELPGDWALQVSLALEATSYVNPIGGRELFDPLRFGQRGIELSFLEHMLPNYCQGNGRFVAGLSIIDVLMFNSIEQTRRMVQAYQLRSNASCVAGDAG